MEEKLTNSCSFSGVKPIMADLPYPPIQVRDRNPAYANLLQEDYCGAVSELSAVAQYINNENRISHRECALARTLLGIAMAEMMHLQKLGELICLLGGRVSYEAVDCKGCRKLWTPAYLDIPEQKEQMLLADIQAEQDAIRQYKGHIRVIRDECVRAALERIIQDEEYHIMLLRNLLEQCKA